MADKQGRVRGIIKKDLSNIIIYELKNPLTDFASVSDVEVTSDYSYCKVYVSHIQPERIDELVAYLNNHKGQIRSMLAKQISIYKCPELIFIADKLYDQAHEMDVMINEAVNRKPRTLKDVYGKSYKTPEEKEKEKEERMKKPSNKKTGKTASGKTSTAAKAPIKKTETAKKPAAKASSKKAK